MLAIDKKVLEEVKWKHTASGEVKEDSLLHGPINRVINSYSNDTDGSILGRAAFLTKICDGPLHIDSDHSHHMLLSKKFKIEAKNLREQIVLLARTLAWTFVDNHSIDSLTTCILIPLNKNREVRSIGIGERLR